MPLSKSLKEGLKGSYSDLVNTTGKNGGSIEAAMFLNHFVEKETKWAHLDIAGPVVDDSLNKKANQSIASGFGVQLLIDFVRNN